MSGLREAFDEIVADVPVYGDLDHAIQLAHHQRRRRMAQVAGLVATAAALVVVATVLAVTRDDGGAPEPAEPTRTPTSTSSADADADEARDPIPREGSSVLGVRQLTGGRLEVRGEVVPGDWNLTDSRYDVWLATNEDEAGYLSAWWGKGTTTHQMPPARGGVVISQDARWLVWTRTAPVSAGPNPPRVMEVVDTATGAVRWSRDATADAPDIGPLAVTNDGVVLFAHCLEPFLDSAGFPQCADARVDVWVPQVGVTGTVPAEVIVENGPAGTIPALTPLVQVTGAHNGVLVRDAPSSRPKYVRVSTRGGLEVVATVPRNTVAISADERFALLATECVDRSVVCDWSALSLADGESRSIPSLSDLVSIPTYYDLPVNPYVVERDDLVVVRDPNPPHSALARCSLAQARCVRIRN